MKYKYLLILILIPVVFLSGCQSYTTLQENDINYPSINPTPKGSQILIHLYYPEKEMDILTREIRTVNLENDSIETAVINELLKGTYEKRLRNVIPDGVRMLSIDTQNSVAYVNFNKALINERLKEKEEALIIYSIVNSLASIENIDKVQILIEGEKREKFNKYKLNEPIKFSNLMVEVPYISPINKAEEYYNALIAGDYRKMFEMELMQHDNKKKYEEYKLYYQTTNQGLTDYEITDYEIIKYDIETILLYDMNLQYLDGHTVRTGWKELKLKYEDNKLKLDKRIRSGE